MSHHPALRRSSKEVERAMLVLVLINVIYAVVIGMMRDQIMLVLGCLVPLVLSIAVAHRLRPGAHVDHVVTALALCGLVMLQARLLPGSYVAHANMFISLCLLLQYENWRPLVAAGGVLVVARVVWSSWWDGGIETTSSALLKPVYGDVLMLLMLTGALVVFARRLQQRSVERFEMEFLVNAMGRSGPVRLNLDVIRAESEVGQRLKDVQGRMAVTLRQVREAVFSMHAVAGELSTSSVELMHRTEHTDQGLRDAAMSLDQINVIVQDSTRGAKEAREMSNQASEKAAGGSAVVAEVVKTMNEIDASSKRITDIIGVIDSIAFQTNILALNAAVEAARAGEQGRGFAVVATEVRMLAGRSAQAAKEIKMLIASSAVAVERGTMLANEAGSRMYELVESVKRVGAVFDSLTDDTSEHAQGINVVTSSVKDLDEVTRQNVAVAERTGSVAHELQVQAAKLAEGLSAFRLGDDAAVQTLLEEAHAAVRLTEQQRQRAKSSGSGDGAASEGVQFF